MENLVSLSNFYNLINFYYSKLYVNVISKISKIIFDDTKCLFCGSFSFSSICNNCFISFKEKANLRRLPSLFFINNLKTVYFDNLFFLFSYDDFYQFIKIYKFENRVYVINYLLKLLKDYSNFFSGYDLMAFVPNHYSKANFFICNLLSNYLNLRIANFFDIHVSNKTLQHTITDKKKRIENIKDKFILSSNFEGYFNNEINKIIVFDDVCTTGSTLNEVCKLIKKKNDRILIDCFVLAKA